MHVSAAPCFRKQPLGQPGAVETFILSNLVVSKHPLPSDLGSLISAADLITPLDPSDGLRNVY